MEVNIKNAFFIVVRMSWRYCNVSLDLTSSLIKSFEVVIYMLLENPISTTLILSIFTLIILILLTISFMILVAVSCLIAIIIICEGIICLACLLVIGIALCCIMITTANIYGMLIWLDSLFKLDTRKTVQE